MVVPQALRATRLRPDRKYCTIGRISHELGWKYQDVVSTLEERRKTKAQEYYAKKKATAKLQATAAANVKGAIGKYDETLAAFGY